MTGGERFVVEAVRVPWSVSPALSGVELFASDEEMPRLRLRVVPLEVRGADEVTVEIRLTSPGGRVNVWPGEYPRLIDTARLAVVPEPGRPIAEYRERLRAFWTEHGYHPCPNFYIVPGSSWVASLGIPPAKVKHFIVEGDGLPVRGDLCRSRR